MKWRAYESLPQFFDPLIRNVTSAIPPAGQWTTPLFSLDGSAGGKPSRLILGGELSGIHYLIEQFFDSPPSIDFRESVPLWSLRRSLEDLAKGADLTLVRLHTSQSRLFRPEGFLAVPAYVHCSVALPGLSRALAGKTSLRGSLNRAQRMQWKVRWTKDVSDFDQFFNEMHLPFVRNRFGVDATYYGYPRLRRAFRFGELCQLTERDENRAGLLCRRESQTYAALVFGESDRGDPIFHRGGGVLLYQAFLQRAEKIGCSVADLGLAPAQLLNGILRHKRKWRIRIRHVRRRRGDLFYHWKVLNKPVADFLARTALIVPQRGKLAALVLIDETLEKPVDRFLKSLWIPGLDRVFLVHGKVFSANETLSPGVTSLSIEGLWGKDSGTLKRMLCQSVSSLDSE